MKVMIFAAIAAALVSAGCQAEPPPGQFKKWGREAGYGKAPAKKQASAKQKEAELVAAVAPKMGADKKSEPAAPKTEAPKTEAPKADGAAAKTPPEEATGKVEPTKEEAEAEAAAAPAEEASDIPEALLAEGKKVFQQACQACHQGTGQGLPGAFPPLVGSEWVTGPPQRPIAIVLHGLMGEIEVKGQKWNGVMAGLGAQLKDDQIAAVLTYVRNEWGNSASAVDASMVAAIRKETKGQGMWNGGAAVNQWFETSSTR